MAKPTKANVLKAYKQIQDLMLSDKFLAATREARQDPQLLKQAKADSRAFLKKRHVSVPQSLNVTISGCVTVCAVVFGVEICVTLCGSVEF